MNYRSIALVSHMLLSAATINAQAPAKPISVKILIDSIESALYHNYIFPDKAKLMSDKLKSQLKKGAYKSLKDPVQIKHALESDLASAHQDGHLHIEYAPARAEQLMIPPQERSTEEDSLALRQMRVDNFLFNRVEILNGNIGYVQFNGFSHYVKEAKPTLTAAFSFVRNTDAVIIDLRSNHGGSPWMVRQVASYFVKERTHLNDIYERKSDAITEFWADPKDVDGVTLLMPVYILTSNGTFSAAEDFCYAMQVNKRAVIVGETTGGGAHPNGPVVLGQGYVMNVPVARSINPITRTDWEGTGVIPEVAVRADEALVKAQELILTNKLSTPLNDYEKQRVHVSLYALRPVVMVSSDQLKSLAGRYEAQGNPNFHLQISSNLEKLILRQSWDGVEIAFDALSDTEFFCKPLQFPLKFTKNAEGETTQVLAFGRDVWIRAKEK